MIVLIFFYLLDYQGMNMKFSWTREGNSSQMALLDRFFINKDWEVHYRSTNYYLPCLFSDHSPLVLDTGCIQFPTV
jgi:endonuclease/exonuclease/phosphatase family metal-dependent hydrolase